MPDRITYTIRSTLVALAIGPLSCQALGQVINEDSKLLASDGNSDDQFGRSVSIDNGIVAIGAYLNNASGSGTAYLLNYTTGTQLFQLFPADGMHTGNNFGVSISLDNEITAVGADSEDTNGSASGAVYLFSSATGTQLLKLNPNDPAAGDRFGISVSLRNGIVAVGSSGDDDNGTSSGSAYLFDVATGMQLFKLLPDDGQGGDNFGASISMRDGIVAIGATGDDDNGSSAGSAYLFDAVTGTQLAKLLPVDGSAGNFFGRSIAIANGTVAVGASFANTNGPSSGSAYLFDTDTGAQIFKLLPDDGESADFFGTSVSLANNIVAIGAHGNDDSGSNTGSAYLFDAATGVQTSKLLPSDGVAHDFFGISLAQDGDGTVIVGATGNGDTGSAYVFSTSCPADTNHDGALTPADFTAWIAAFNAAAPECDQNNDGSCTAADFTAWIANYNAGC